jgi:cell division protein FtsW
MVGLMVLYTADFNMILRHSKWLLLMAVILLGLVYVPHIGMKINGARRWIRLGPMTFQPSEFAKLVLVIATAKLLSEREKQLRSFTRGFLPPVMLGIPFIAIIAVEDLGSAVVLGLILATMWFISGIRLIHLMSLVPGAAAALVVGVIMKPYRVGRIIGFLFHDDAMGRNWHAMQGLIAVGTGGWSGLGLGMGIQKHHFVAAIYTDFIFADVCEELGFIGAVALLLLFAAFITIGFRVAYKSPDFVGSVLTAGLAAMVAVPVLINVAIVLRCLPTKGLALPFISYGGSSLLVNMSAVGLLMNISRRNEQTQEVRRPVAVTPERRLWRWGRAGAT